MKKIKILYSGETTGAASGFGVYGFNVLSRLVKNPLFDIAEFASFGGMYDNKYQNAKWRYYPNHVEEGHPDKAQYESNHNNKFGAWRYERVLLDFKPDIVFTIRDPWMMEHEHKSHLRQFYHLSIMPTVDSAPQQHSWIEMFSSADSVFTYSDWAIPVLKEQSSGKISPVCSAYPGIEECFYPIEDNRELKKSLGLPADSFIIGNVMRNQKRKLIEDLFMAFKIFLQKYNDTEIGQKTYLLIHTSYPDFAGWDIQKLIKEYGISSRVFFTYYCQSSGNIFLHKFAGTKAHSPYSGLQTAGFPNVGVGASREQLVDIYRCMDLYVQYAICFAKDQEVKTKRGWIPIQDIVVGDECFTHKGRWRNVIGTTINSPHSQQEKMKEITLCSDYEKIRVTEGHNLFCYTKNEIHTDKSRSIREKFGDKLRNNENINIFNKHPVSSLASGDLLIYPIDDTVEDILNIDLVEYSKSSDFISDTHISLKYGHNYSRYITVDEDFCKFLGLYVADGNSYNGVVKITSNIAELENKILSNNILSRIGNKNPSIRFYKDRKAIDIMLSSRLHYDYFRKNCGKLEYKQLPSWTEMLPLNKQQMILQGLFMGDGHYIQKKNISIYSTISKTLASQIKNILRRLRINFNTRIVNKEGNRKPQYKFEVYGDIKNGKFIKDKHNTSNFYYNTYHILQIKDIQTTDYKDNTYNIEVEGDNSLTIRGCAAANCEGL